MPRHPLVAGGRLVTRNWVLHRPEGKNRYPGPAGPRVHAGCAVTRRARYAPARTRVWSWLASAALLLAGWAAVAAVWPITLVTVAGYGAAWLSGWLPPGSGAPPHGRFS